MPKHNLDLVVIQQGYEEWKGEDSVPRVLELWGVGLSKTAVAKRFKKSTVGIDKAVARYLAKKGSKEKSA